jgi:hypothetical protein
MSIQINELGKGEKANNAPNRYHLQSKKKDDTFDCQDQPLIAERPAKVVATTTKEKKTQNTSSAAKEHVSEVREPPKPLSFFSFEHEIQNIRILVPL